MRVCLTLAAAHLGVPALQGSVRGVPGGARSRGSAGSTAFQAQLPSQRRREGCLDCLRRERGQARASCRRATGASGEGLVDPKKPNSGQVERTKTGLRKAAVAAPQAVPLLGSVEPAPRPADSLLRTIGRWGLRACGGATALVALLYITECFEGIMHNSAGLSQSSTLLAAAAAGLTGGALHTLAGPDHLAGLAPLVIGRRRSVLQAFGLGALWGSGHATGQVLVGLACLAVHLKLLRGAWADMFSQAGSVIVGVSLICIGLLGFYEARAFTSEESSEQGDASSEGRFGWATYATGVLHGLQPDAVIFVAPALALQRSAAAAFVSAFGIGTLLSMASYTALLGALCGRSPKLLQISACASWMAILLGCSICLASLGIPVPLPGF